VKGSPNSGDRAEGEDVDSANAQVSIYIDFVSTRHEKP